MTARAVRCGRAEGRPDVTAVARDVDVRAVKNETGAEVIECLLRRGGLRAEQARCENGDERQYQQSLIRFAGCPVVPDSAYHCKDLTSLNESAVWQRAQSDPNSPS